MCVWRVKLILKGILTITVFTWIAEEIVKGGSPLLNFSFRHSERKKRGREGGRERGREGGREGEREGGKEGGRE